MATPPFCAVLLLPLKEGSDVAKSRSRGSNPEPVAYKATSLPIELPLLLNSRRRMAAIAHRLTAARWC